MVTRMEELEGLSFTDLADTVGQWQGREGVVVRYGDGTVVKVKSKWWFRSGFTGRRRQEAWWWRKHEAVRRQEMQVKYRTREQRLAVTAVSKLWNVRAVFEDFTDAVKAEFIYSGAKLRVIILSFAFKEQRELAEVMANERGLLARKAYSNRTATRSGTQVETVWKNEIF